MLIVVLLLLAIPFRCTVEAWCPRRSDSCFEGVSDRHQGVDQLRKIALACLQRHEEATALTLALDALAVGPPDPDTRAVLAKILLRNGEYQQGLRAASDLPDQVHESYGLLTDVWAAELVLGTTPYFEDGASRAKFQVGIRILDATSKLDPDNFSIRRTIGWRLLETLHINQEAYRELKQLFALWPDDLQTVKLLGLAAYRTGHVDLAHALFLRANKEDSQDRWIQAHLGHTFRAMGQYDKATALYEQIPYDAPDGFGAFFEAQFGLSQIAASRWDTRRAMARADALLPLHPGDPQVQSLLGDMALWDWNLDRAHDHYVEALKAESEYEQARNGVGEVQSRRALRVLTEAYTFRDSSSFRRSFSAASFHLLLGDRTEVLPRFTYWQFVQSGNLESSRLDEGLEVQHHVSRRFEFMLGGGSYRYSEHSDKLMLRMSAKGSPSPLLDLRVSFAAHEPITENANTVGSDLSQDVYGMSAVIRTHNGLSLDASYTYAQYSDANTLHHGPG